MNNNNSNKIKVLSFFSGLGFLDLGFSEAGFNIAFVNEINSEFLDAYQYARRNFEDRPKYGYSNNSASSFLRDDIWGETFSSIPQNEIIGFIGGPPCPDFSTAGKNAGAQGTHGQLTTVYVSLICKRRPAFFVLENVKGLYQTQKHRIFYESQKRRLKKAGYILYDSIENALSYGVPQYRDRLILVGFRRSVFSPRIDFSFANGRQYDLQNILQAPWPLTKTFCENDTVIKPEGIFENLTVEHWLKKNIVDSHPNAMDYFNPRKIQRFETILEGDVSGKSFKRLHRWRFSPTAAYGNNEVHLHPYKLRRISVAEALAIQSLPKWFSLPEQLSLSSKFKMVGNGVPFLLASGIARNIYDTIDKFKVTDGE